MFILMCIKLILFIIFMIKRLKPIRNFINVFESFDPNIDQLYPQKKLNVKLKKFMI